LTSSQLPYILYLHHWRDWGLFVPKSKMIYVSEAAHQRLKLLAARKNRPMGRVVEDLVERETEDLTNPWLTPAGLRLQERMLGEVWGDPALDIYNDA